MGLLFLKLLLLLLIIVLWWLILLIVIKSEIFFLRLIERYRFFFRSFSIITFATGISYLRLTNIIWNTLKFFITIIIRILGLWQSNFFFYTSSWTFTSFRVRTANIFSNHRVFLNGWVFSNYWVFLNCWIFLNCWVFSYHTWIFFNNRVFLNWFFHGILLIIFFYFNTFIDFWWILSVTGRLVSSNRLLNLAGNTFFVFETFLKILFFWNNWVLITYFWFI